jgi:hypothetical protein
MEDFDSKPLDTKYIQLKSVVAYMECLGYLYSGKYFYQMNLNFTNSAFNTISFRNAVLLHNQALYDNHGKHLRFPWYELGLDKYKLNKAKACRIVQNAKLQSKKNGDIVVQSNLVKFVDESYYDLFLNQ